MYVNNLYIQTSRKIISYLVIIVHRLVCLPNVSTLVMLMLPHPSQQKRQSQQTCGATCLNIMVISTETSGWEAGPLMVQCWTQRWGARTANALHKDLAQAMPVSTFVESSNAEWHSNGSANATGQIRVIITVLIIYYALLRWIFFCMHQKPQINLQLHPKYCDLHSSLIVFSKYPM